MMWKNSFLNYEDKLKITDVDDHDDEEVEEFYNDLSNTRKSYHRVVLGDFKAKIANDIRQT